MSVTDVTQNVLNAYLNDINSFNDNNLPPLEVAYPEKDTRDALYAVSEEQVRAAIYTLPGVTYGVK